jgi:hypothetical protein
VLATEDERRLIGGPEATCTPPRALAHGVREEFTYRIDLDSLRGPEHSQCQLLLHTVERARNDSGWT